MIVTFCGHSHFASTLLQKQRLLALLEEQVGNMQADFYLGGYGGFDEFAYMCSKQYKETHPEIALVFVTPYLTESYERNHLRDAEKRYDAVLYPEIEDKPRRFAISYRNKYMVEKADIVIAYIDHSWGGAYQTYLHAKRKGKVVFNLAEIID